jgi:hypothetical protein
LKSARAEARTSISTAKLRFCASPKDSGFDSFSIRFAGGKKEKANVLGGMLRSPVQTGKGSFQYVKDLSAGNCWLVETPRGKSIMKGRKTGIRMTLVRRRKATVSQAKRNPFVSQMRCKGPV